MSSEGSHFWLLDGEKIKYGDPEPGYTRKLNTGHSKPPGKRRNLNNGRGPDTQNDAAIAIQEEAASLGLVQSRLPAICSRASLTLALRGFDVKGPGKGTKYTGLNWNNNSCAFDSTLELLQCVYAKDPEAWSSMRRGLEETKPPLVLFWNGATWQ